MKQPEIKAGPLDLTGRRRQLEEQAEREGVDLQTFCKRLDDEQLRKRQLAEGRMPYFQALAERLTREGLDRAAVGQRLADEGLEPLTAAEVTVAARLAFQENPVLLDIPGDTTPGKVH